MARLLNRSTSTISGELRLDSIAGPYGSALAQQTCRYRCVQNRPVCKLHLDSILLGAVEHFLRLRWSPEQIALALARLYLPRAQTCRATAKSNSTLLPTRSMAGPARRWACDLRRPSIDNASSAVPLPQP